MKYLYPITLALLILLTGHTNSLTAQSPLKLSYQAVMRDATDHLLVNQSVRVKVSLLRNSASGTLVYSETHNVSSNANGLVTLQIGSGSVISGSMSSINWATGPYFVKTETDPNGGNNYTISAASELLSVPYALYAANGGTPGPQGPAGPTGPTGPAGEKGDKGDNGLVGLKGDQGDKGDKGDKGDMGDLGDDGPKGDTGETGEKGDKGDKGLKGDKGDKGDTGDMGDQGDTGPQGPQGLQGPPGPIAGFNMQINFNDNGLGGADPELLYDKNSNHMTIGSSTVHPAAALEIKSTSGGLLLPRLNTAERDALNAPEGMVIYNTDTKKFQGFAGVVTPDFASSEVAAAEFILVDNGVDVAYLAQTFTPGTSGLLHSIAFNISSPSPSFKLRIELYEGNPPGLSGTYMDGQDVNVSQSGWMHVQFPSNPSLTSGVVYYLVIKPLVETGLELGVYTSDIGSPGQHSGGSMYTWNEASGEFDISAGNDMDFRVIPVAATPFWVDMH